MTQASLEVVKMQGLELISVLKVEKTASGKRHSKLIKFNVRETRTIEEVKNTQNIRQYALF